MEYIFVKWLHNDPEYPVLLYSELDERRFETRKVEIFLDGTKGYASEFEECRTDLGYVPVPTLSEIAEDPQFEPFEITREEFEKVWFQRKSKPG
jgi:hypothetical protein